MVCCTETLDPAIGALAEVIVKAGLDMNGAPHCGALEAKALLASRRLLGMATMQGKAVGDAVELVEVRWLAECVWNGSKADDRPTILGETRPHNPNAESNWARKDVGNRWTLGKAEVEECYERRVNDQAIGKAAAGQSDLKNIAGFRC